MSKSTIKGGFERLHLARTDRRYSDIEFNDILPDRLVGTDLRRISTPCEHLEYPGIHLPSHRRKQCICELTLVVHAIEAVVFCNAPMLLTGLLDIRPGNVALPCRAVVMILNSIWPQGRLLSMTDAKKVARRHIQISPLWGKPHCHSRPGICFSPVTLPTGGPLATLNWRMRMRQQPYPWKLRHFGSCVDSVTFLAWLFYYWALGIRVLYF